MTVNAEKKVAKALAGRTFLAIKELEAYASEDGRYPRFAIWPSAKEVIGTVSRNLGFFLGLVDQDDRGWEQYQGFVGEDTRVVVDIRPGRVDLSLFPGLPKKVLQAFKEAMGYPPFCAYKGEDGSLCIRWDIDYPKAAFVSLDGQKRPNLIRLF